METFKQDLRYALRMLLARPGFTAIAIITIALGIGINTAIFSVVNGVLLKPLPFPAADKLVAIFTVLKNQNNDLDLFSPANFLDLQKQATSFEAVAAYTESDFDLMTAGDEPQSISGTLVTHDFFAALGVPALFGRTFTEQDDVPGNNQVAVISDALWQQRFGGRQDVIGSSITINSLPYTIIGIVPSSAAFPEDSNIWAPLAFTDEQRTMRGMIFLQAIGRLKPNFTVTSAKQELNLIAARLEREVPDYNTALGMRAMPLEEMIVGDVRTALIVLAAAVGFVLLIACANLANLLVASASTRTREFAVRAALGASKTRLIRQLLTESLALSLAGGLCGIALSFWSLPLLKAFSPTQLPRLDEIAIDWRVLIFALLLCAITGILFGLAPGFSFSRPDLQNSLKEGTRSLGSGPQRTRLGKVLIVSQVCLVLILLTGAGLMIRSFVQLRSVDPGFRKGNLISFELNLPDAKYEERERKIVFYRQLLERVRSVPGTRSVAVADVPPFTAGNVVSDVSFRIQGRPEPLPGQRPLADFTRVSPDYFKTMGIPLLQGRYFNDFDNESAQPVCIISKELARNFFGRQDPIGQNIQLGRLRPITIRIVAVVGDVKRLRLDRDIRPEIYVPYLQLPGNNLNVIVQTDQPQRLAADLKNQVWTIDKNLPVRYVFTVSDLVARSFAPAKAGMLMITVFAGLALLLAVVGLYGLISYSVSNRTREIGIRMALGARRGTILRLVLGSGMGLTLTGLVLGVALSLALTRFLASLLYQVSPTDPLVLVSVALILLATAFLACYIPARRAAKVDPMNALRYE